jgi:hypothetical protein
MSGKNWGWAWSVTYARFFEGDGQCDLGDLAGLFLLALEVIQGHRDLGRAHRLARDVRSGIIWVNTYRAVSAMAPIGGFKNSGYGRESGIDSVLAYTELKTVWINLSQAPMPDPFVMR